MLAGDAWCVPSLGRRYALWGAAVSLAKHIMESAAPEGAATAGGERDDGKRSAEEREADERGAGERRARCARSGRGTVLRPDL